MYSESSERNAAYRQKVAQCKKLRKTLLYLFTQDGLERRNIYHERDDEVAVEDILASEHFTRLFSAQDFLNAVARDSHDLILKEEPHFLLVTINGHMTVRYYKEPLEYEEPSIRKPCAYKSTVLSSPLTKPLSVSPGLSPPSAGPPIHPSGQGLPSTFKSKPTLAQEIYDEFLVCKICLDAFKNPKCLECLHTFCEHCIESHVQSESMYKKYSDYCEFTCPLCRKRTQLPIGGIKKLPDNFFVSNLSEMVGRQRVTKFPFCDICKMVNQKFCEGTAKCLDCAKMLCPSCVVAHQEIEVTSGHSIFDIKIEKNYGCREHPDEVVRFYCEPCELCICVLCTFKEHRHHKVMQFSEAVTKYKAPMEMMVNQCLDKVDQFDRCITSLSGCEEILMAVRQKIKDTAASFVQEIERREHQLLSELDNMYGSDCIEYVDRKQDFSNHVENIRSTCKLAKTILGGKDIELLLMRKDVQEKLAYLNTLKLEQLPKTVSKIVEFVTGEVNLGYLMDHDRTLLNTMKEKTSD